MYREIKVEHSGKELMGRLSSTKDTKAWIIFAHGSGSSRKSKRNNWVANELNKEGFGTLLLDLLTPDEDSYFQNRFNIPMLSERLALATDWLMNSPDYNGEKMGYFGASTGSAAALTAAAQTDPSWPLYAIVSRGGRPDLATKKVLNAIDIPTLLIVGSHDEHVIPLNEWASMELMNSKIALVPGATHLFEEEGALEEVARLTNEWFSIQLDNHSRKTEKKYTNGMDQFLE